MHARFSVESRQAMFRAVVAATAAGQTEVTPTYLAAALVVDSEVVSIFEQMSLSAGDIVATVGLSKPLEDLHQAELSLTHRNLQFGSPEHIQSLKPLYLSREAQEVVTQLDVSFGSARKIVTVLDLLEAFVSQIPDLSSRFVKAGVTPEAIRNQRH